MPALPLGLRALRGEQLSAESGALPGLAWASRLAGLRLKRCSLDVSCAALSDTPGLMSPGEDTLLLQAETASWKAPQPSSDSAERRTSRVACVSCCMLAISCTEHTAGGVAQVVDQLQAHWPMAVPATPVSRLPVSVSTTASSAKTLALHSNSSETLRPHIAQPNKNFNLFSLQCACTPGSTHAWQGSAASGASTCPARSRPGGAAAACCHVQPTAGTASAHLLRSASALRPAGSGPASCHAQQQRLLAAWPGTALLRGGHGPDRQYVACVLAAGAPVQVPSEQLHADMARLHGATMASAALLAWGVWLGHAPPASCPVARCWAMCCAASARQVLYWHAHRGNACWQGSGPALAAPSVSALCHSRCCKASGIFWCRSRQALEQAPPSTRAATAPCVLRRHKGWPPSKEHVLPFACSTTHTSVKSEAAHAPTQLQAPLYIRHVGSLESQAWNTRIKPSNCTCHQQDPWMQ